MKPNDSQTHSHFVNYTHVRVANVQNFCWKGKQEPNWVSKTPLEIS
jgi:hypothetical protein